MGGGSIDVLDAEKAFDTLNWRFMLKLMQKLALGNNVLKWIEEIYKEQSAKIIVNGVRTEECKINKGTMQGCYS